MRAGTPTPIKTGCPICGSKDGRCRERDGFILCMNEVRRQQGDRVGDYVFSREADGGDWGIWCIPNENKEKLKQLRNDRVSLELSQLPYEASRAERHEAYSALLSQLSLAPADLAELEARGLTREQIAEIGFKSCEKFQPLQDEVNWRVPGLTATGRSLMAPWDGGGYLCPVRDVAGHIVGMQIRLRRPPTDPNTGKTGGKYRWLASTSQKRPNAPRTQVEGELPLSVIQPAGSDRSTVWLVEGTGPKPALTAYRTGCVVIGASGAQWASSPKTFRATLQAIAPERLILAPDAGSIQPDLKGNQHTLRRYTRLHDLLTSWDYELEVAWWQQEYKPQNPIDQRQVGDIDEIESLDGIELISFDRLRQLGAQALQASRDMDGNVELLARAFPAPGPTPEPDPLPEDASDSDRLWNAIAHYRKVEANGNPFDIFPLFNSIKREFNLTSDQVAQLCAFQRDRDAADGGLVAINEDLVDVFGEMEARADGLVLPGVPCGFYDLDAMTQGFQREDLIIAAGRPSMGKTALLNCVSRNIAAIQKLPVAIFSLEMSRLQMVYRWLSAELSIETSRLRTGRLTPNEWTALGQAIGTISEWPLYVDDTPNPTVAEIRSKCLRLLKEAGAIGAIVIDYLQLMAGSSDNRVQELARITRELKGLARELHVPIIVLSQLSRGVEARTNKRPLMSDLRESGGIEQNSDVIMMLYREEYYDPDTPERGIAEVIITKHRNGPTGTIRLLFEPQYTRFRNLARIA